MIHSSFDWGKPLAGAALPEGGLLVSCGVAGHTPAGFETRHCEGGELRRAAVRVEHPCVLLGSSAAATSCGGSRRNRHVRHLIALPRQRKSDRRWKRLESTRSSTRGRQRSTCSRALLHVALGGSGEAARLQGAVHRLSRGFGAKAELGRDRLQRLDDVRDVLVELDAEQLGAL